MIRKFNIIIFALIAVLGCNEFTNSSGRLDTNVLSSKVDSVFIPKNNNTELKMDEKVLKVDFPKHPKMNKEYKFLAAKDTIKYILILKRTNDSTIVFRVDYDADKNTKMHYGTAILNTEASYKIEKSSITGNPYKAYEYIEVKDSARFEIRIGIDSIGSGDRLLVRFIEKYGNNIVSDLNMTN